MTIDNIQWFVIACLFVHAAATTHTCYRLQQAISLILGREWWRYERPGDFDD